MCASFWAAVAVTHGRRTASRRRLVACTAVLLVTFLGAASTATAATTASIADPTVISDWNALAIGTFSADPKKVPQETPLYMGFVQAAVYDAVVGIDRRYEPYRFDARAPRGTSAQAAAVAAAHKVLVTYSPYATANLDAAYATSLAQIPDGKAKTRGIVFGTLAADNLITMRTNDGDFAGCTRRGGPGRLPWSRAGRRGTGRTRPAHAERRSGSGSLSHSRRTCRSRPPGSRPSARR